MQNLLSYVISLFADSLYRIIYIVPVLLVSLPLHELSHGYVAWKLGDPTAKNAGRLTLNPIRHLDVLGTILIIFTGFGWAKPVPVDPRYFKSRKQGMALTAFAGPVSNLLLAFLTMAVQRLLVNAALPEYVSSLLTTMAYINIGLAIFNLIPINPLDGSRILALVLPERVEFLLYRYEMYIQAALFALLLFTNFLSAPLNYLVSNVYSNFQTILNWIPV